MNYTFANNAMDSCCIKSRTFCQQRSKHIELLRLSQQVLPQRSCNIDPVLRNWRWKRYGNIWKEHRIWTINSLASLQPSIRNRRASRSASRVASKDAIISTSRSSLRENLLKRVKKLESAQRLPTRSAASATARPIGKRKAKDQAMVTAYILIRSLVTYCAISATRLSKTW